MDNPYTTPDTGGGAAFKPHEAVGYVDLPRVCPMCAKKVKKPTKFMATREARTLRFNGWLVSTLVAVACTLATLFIFGFVSLWTTLIPGILVNIAYRKRINSMPKHGEMRCALCSWSETYLVQLR